ncbi:MAG: dihydrofolate reductase [Coriobacteriaceae bacterium]|nr:dihydrofolate reductase [Coriobacteriaceae bacterium]
MRPCTRRTSRRTRRSRTSCSWGSDGPTVTRPLVLIVTTSLDGFIAETDGGVGWLAPPPASTPADYDELVASIDTLVMGSATYLASLDLAGGTEIFSGKRVCVFTSREGLPATAGVEFVQEPAEEFVPRLKEEPGGSIWLFGGGKLATALSDAGLVDEYLVAVQPILLGDGIPLWRTPHARTRLELVAARAWPGGIAELRYRRRP